MACLEDYHNYGEKQALAITTMEVHVADQDIP